MEQLCRTRLFELFPELPGTEVEECYMRCGGVLRVTYQMLLERMASAAALATAARSSSCSTSTSSREAAGSSSAVGAPAEPPGPPAEIEEQLAALAGERARTEEAMRATKAEAELATEQLEQNEARVAEAEAACEAAEREAQADRLRREAVAEQLSDVLGRMQRLESDFHQRVEAAKAAVLAQAAAEQECAAAVAAGAAAAAADEDAAAEATAEADHRRWSQRVAAQELAVASNREALDSAAARTEEAENVERRARAEEAELQESIHNLQLQQEHDELEQAERAAQEKRETEERERLENETSVLEVRLAKVERDLASLRDLDHLRTGAAASALQSQSPQSKPKSAEEVGGTSTDLNGIEPLIDEDEVSYVERQQRLAAEAKERMAAKFGNNKGEDLSQLKPPPSQAGGRSGRTSPKLPPGSGILQVRVVAASNILAADPSGKSDPFLRLVLGKTTRSTAVVPKTLNPVYNETITLPFIVSESAQGLGSEAFLLRVEVWDHDRHSRDDFLGECSVHLLHLFNGLWGGERRIHYAFDDPRGRIGARERKQVKQRAGENPYGTVDLTFTFVPDGGVPSLSTWMAERHLSAYIPRIEEAMIRAEVPGDEIVPMLDGMDAGELEQFIEACDTTPSSQRSQELAVGVEVKVQAHEEEEEEEEEVNEVKVDALDDGDDDDVHFMKDEDEDEDEELVEISVSDDAASGAKPLPVIAVDEAGRAPALLQMQIDGFFEEDDDISDDDYSAGFAVEDD